MKNLLILIMTIQCMAFSSDWSYSTSTDEMTGDIQAFAMSPSVKSTKRMNFPFSNMETWMGIGCNENKKSMWVYIGFDSDPVILNTNIHDGYSTINTRVKWDDDLEKLTFNQDFGSKVIHFKSDLDAIKKIMKHNNFLLELQWYGESNVYFKYPLKGATKVINKMKKTCNIN